MKSHHCGSFCCHFAGTVSKLTTAAGRPRALGEENGIGSGEGRGRGGTVAGCADQATVDVLEDAVEVTQLVLDSDLLGLEQGRVTAVQGDVLGPVALLLADLTQALL